MKAMILAAGRGERLRPLTQSIPKPLVTIAGKPLILYHIERLARAGVRDIVINQRWMGNTIQKTIGSGQTWGVHIHYTLEKDKYGTGGGIQNALPLLGKEPFLVISADIMTNYPFDKLINKELSDTTLGHLIVVTNPTHHPEGDYGLQGAFIVGKQRHELSYTFGSIALLRHELFMMDRPPFSIATPFNRAIEERKITGEYFTGYHCNVDTLERKKSVEEAYEAGFIYSKES